MEFKIFEESIADLEPVFLITDLQRGKVMRQGTRRGNVAQGIPRPFREHRVDLRDRHGFGCRADATIAPFGRHPELRFVIRPLAPAGDDQLQIPLAIVIKHVKIEKSQYRRLNVALEPILDFQRIGIGIRKTNDPAIIIDPDENPPAHGGIEKRDNLLFEIHALGKFAFEL